MKKKLILSLVFILAALSLLYSVMAKGLVFSAKESNKLPPKIIRTCCQFGSDVKVMGVPFRRLNAISAPGRLGAHTYLGDKEENNGIIYSHRGGFIDVGHLRDIADWTAYLYYSMLEQRNQDEFSLRLGREGGVKELFIHHNLGLTDQDRLVIAGRIAFDLSVWHEIATWFGVSYIPLIPERYSSFSPEDLYSNALGVQLGIQAIKSGLPYEEAMTVGIQNILDTLYAVETVEDTKRAMQAVEGIWWRRDVPLPSSRFLLKRYYDAYQVLTPWLIPEDEGKYSTHALRLPERLSNGLPAADFYTLSIRTNYRIPVKKIFPDRRSKIISNADFPEMIHWISKDVSEKFSVRVQ